MNRLTSALLLFMFATICLVFSVSGETFADSTPVAAKPTNPLGHSSEITLFALSPDGRFAVTSDENETSFIWDMKKGALVREVGNMDVDRVRVVAAAFSPDSAQLLWARNGKIMPVLWDVESGRRVGVLSSRDKGHADFIVSVAFSAGGNYIATGDIQGIVIVWNRADRSVVRRIKAHTGEASHLLFIPGKNELVSAGIDGAVRLWSVSGEKLLATLLEPSDYAVTALVSSPDGQVLYAASEDKTVKGWMVSLRTIRGTLDFDNRQINSIALSPDGDFMALVEEDESVLLWNMRESSIAWRNELDNSATQVQFSPDGKRLYSSGGDNWIREWDVASGNLLKKIGGVNN